MEEKTIFARVIDDWLDRKPLQIDPSKYVRREYESGKMKEKKPDGPKLKGKRDELDELWEAQ